MPKCTYCEKETDVQISGTTVCEQCAIDQELARRQYVKNYVETLEGENSSVTRNGFESRDLEEPKGE